MGELDADTPRRANKSHRVLWFHPRELLPARGGGELRVTGLIAAVVDAGHQVLVIQPGGVGAQPQGGFDVFAAPVRRGADLAAAKILSSSPLRTARLSRSGIRLARDRIRRFEPDIAVVSDLLSWPVARSLLPSVPWILDAHNVESQLFADMASNRQGMFDKVTLVVDRARVGRQEPRVVAEADGVTAVSADDARQLAAFRAGRQAPVVVPSSVPTPLKPAQPGTEPVVLFVGTLDFPPNTAAVEELVRHVMPRIRESVPEARLVIAGRRPSAALRAEIAPLRWVEMREDVADLDPVYSEARCTVLPIRSGGGSRLKVYEALSYGLPIVGTRRALSGVELRDDVAVVAESAGDLVDAAVPVLRDDDLARRLAAASRSWFIERLSWKHVAQPFLSLIDELA